MPVITSEPISGYAHCAKQTVEGDPCFPQQEVPAIRQTVEFLYADGQGGGSSDPIDQTFARLVERSVSHIRFADPEDATCPHCGGPREISDQVRPIYTRLSDVPPDELVRRQRRATE